MTTPNLAADPAIESIAKQQIQLAARTRHLEIINADGFTEAANYLKEIKAAVKQIDDAEERIKRPLMVSLAEVRKQASDAREPYMAIETRVKAAILTYNREQERIRADEQRRRDAEAALERKRLQAIADAEAAKARQEAQERREAADAAERAGRAADAVRLAAEAVRIEDKAAAKVEKFEERAETTVAPVVQTAAPKVAGVSQRDNWTFRITDPTKINAQFMTPDTAKIGKLVKSLKREARSLIGDGVEIYNEPVIASSRA